MTRLKIGTITKTIGLQGVCRVYSNTDFLEERFKKGNHLYLEDGTRLIVEKATFKGIMVHVKFKEINSIEEAEKYRDIHLYVSEDDLHTLKEDEYYFYELKGCAVFENDQKIGIVTEVIESPAQTLLRIENEDQSFLLPFVKAFVTDVDIEGQRINVKLIEGFL